MFRTCVLNLLLLSLCFCTHVFHSKGKALLCLQFMKTTANIFRVQIRRKITKIFEGNNLSMCAKSPQLCLTLCDPHGL